MRERCHGTTPDPKRPGHRCDTPLGQLHGATQFVCTAPTWNPEAPGNWIRCPRCNTWNRFDFDVREQSA